MISASAWAARVKTKAILKAVKVQSSNTTADVNLGIQCFNIPYTQLIYELPKCQLYKHLPPCNPNTLPTIIFGGTPSLSGPPLSGGNPSSSGSNLSGGQI
jgi:hypothetical protein